MKTSAVRLMGLTILLSGGLLLATALPAWSDQKEGKEKDVPVAELLKDATVTIDQAIKTASDKVPGTVVEAELEREHGKTVWEVEVVGSDGHVTKVHIDAGDGSVIDTETKGHKKHGKHKD